MACRTASSRRRAIMPVKMALKKLRMPTSPTTKLSAPPSSKNSRDARETGRHIAVCFHSPNGDFHFPLLLQGKASILSVSAGSTSKA